MQILVEKKREVLNEWLEHRYPRVAKVLAGKSRRTKGFSNEEVWMLWEHGKEAESYNGNLWTDGITLYSYSTPIAVKCKNSILVNTHFYSTTTSCHRPYVRNSVDVDFEVLRNWISYRELKELYVLDEEGDAVLLYKNSGDDLYILILREGRNEYGVKLSKPCRTVAGAKEMLIPREVKLAIKDRRDVKRQGEWYFIPFPEMQFPRDVIEYPLKLYRRWGAEDKHLGRHIAREKVAWVFSIEEAEGNPYFEHSRIYIFVRGTVRHVRQDHRMLNLGETWHLAVRSPLRAVAATRSGLGWD